MPATRVRGCWSDTANELALKTCTIDGESENIVVDVAGSRFTRARIGSGKLFSKKTTAPTAVRFPSRLSAGVRGIVEVSEGVALDTVSVLVVVAVK